MYSITSIYFKCKLWLKSKITNIPNYKEKLNRLSFIKWLNQKLKHIKRMENNCHIPGLVHAFPCVNIGGLHLVLKIYAWGKMNGKFKEKYHMTNISCQYKVRTSGLWILSIRKRHLVSKLCTRLSIAFLESLFFFCPAKVWDLCT